MDETRGKFVLKAPYQPSGDQPQAIEALTRGVNAGMKGQVLLGVTGSGKTFTMASVIAQVQRPTLVIAHNKTLAAQLCSEFRAFFPDSAVEYFVSYYDYYQPEAYIASSDTYIEKDAAINEEIDRLRHSATAALRERRDVIIVASVSCIYSMGDPSEYEGQMVSLRPGMAIGRDDLIRQLIAIQYDRNDVEFERGTFRVRGDVLEIIPAGGKEHGLRIEFFGDEIESISEFEVVSGHTLASLEHASVYPATHYATDQTNLPEKIAVIERDLKEQVDKFTKEGKLLEAERIAQRTNYDIEMMREIGYCSGIENYSRYFDGRKPGDAPYSLLDYFPKGFLCFIDESHVTVPQIRAMYNGDRARKEQLVEYGFRLPSAFDNRPLLFEEFEQRIGQTIFVSATPGPYEISHASQIVEQIIRPTGLLDPKIILRKATGQVDDLVGEIHQVVAKKQRVLVTTLTKRMAESLTEYLQSMDIRVRYLHSDVTTMDRMALIRGLRLGEYAGGHQPPARGAGLARSVARRDSRRGQGRFPAFGNVARADHRARRAKRRWAGDYVRRCDDGQPDARHQRNQPPPRDSGGVQPRARHHAGVGAQRGASGAGDYEEGGRKRARRDERGRAERADEAGGRPDAVGGEGAGLRAGGEAPRPAAGTQGGKAPSGADSKEAEKDARKHQTPLSLEA